MSTCDGHVEGSHVPCLQHWGSCQGDIPLPVSCMPSKGKKMITGHEIWKMMVYSTQSMWYHHDVTNRNSSVIGSQSGREKCDHKMCSHVGQTVTVSQFTARGNKGC